MLLGFWGVRWLVRHSREPSPPTQAVYDALDYGNDDRANPAPGLRVSSGRPATGPGRVFSHHDTDSVALRRAEASPEFLKLSLLHELAHAEQSDPWFGTIASLAQSVWFFLPHVWWLRSQLIMDQEFMADNAASLRYGTSSRYAASLLSLADSRPAPAADGQPQATGIRSRHQPTKSEVHSPLFQRMLMLLALSVSGRAASAAALVVVAAAGC